MSDGAVAYLNGGTIEGNTANAGAGVYISNGVVHLNGTDIKNNTADYNGGTIHMNNSNYSGGTAYTHNTKFEMTGGAITGNNGTNGSVKTGDEASGIMYLVVLLAAMGTGITVILRKRAKQF